MVLRDHDRSQVIGGWRSLRQRGNELHVESELCLAANPKAQETYDLSLGFNIADPERDIVHDRRSRCERTKRASLKEISVVPFPGNDGARIDTVRRDLDCWLTERGFVPADLEELLRLAQAARPRRLSRAARRGS